jgi:fucose permease
MQTITNVQNATTQQIVLPAADAVKPENDATNENSTETSATSTSTITPSPSLTKITSSDTLTGLPLVSPTSTPSITPSPSIEGVNLLSPALPEQQKEERREKIYKFILSFAYCFSFLAYANAAAALNWSTEQLKNLTKVGDEEIGWVFFIKGFGYLIGTGISGKIYGLLSIKKGQEVKWYRFTPHSLYTLMQLSLATFIAVVPLPSAYWALMILYLFVGISQGFMETGGCSFLVWLWKKQADPWLSFIQFFYGVGSVLSPLIANQILTENPESFLEMRIVHWIIAGLCVLSVIPFPFLKVPEVYDTKLPPTTENGNQASKKKREFLPGKTFWITLGCGLVIGFSTGALISYTGLIFTYCRKKQMSVKGSTFLASAAWMAITFGRLVMTPVMAFIDSRVIIIVSLTGCFIGLGIMLIVGNLVSAWVGTIIFGLFLSPQV